MPLFFPQKYQSNTKTFVQTALIMRQFWNQSMYNIICWFAGPMGQRTKGLKYSFFIISYILRTLKTFYFCNFITKIETVLAKNFETLYEKKIIPGKSDAWMTSHLSHQSSKPAYYIVDWQIYGRVKRTCFIEPWREPGRVGWRAFSLIEIDDIEFAETTKRWQRYIGRN